ncbi:MAG: hypothetical protein ABI644_04170, partial [Arenimonas sp.]
VTFSPWYAAVLGICITLLLFYPGYMSWDSAYQWWQARHARFDAVHPPLMSMIWSVCNKLWRDPGGMFALQITLIWTALAAFATTLERPLWQKVLLVLLLGFWPPLFALSLHIWKDLWTMLAFAWAVVFLAMDLKKQSRTLRIAALIAITAACAFRHNALSGALPLLFWIAHRESIDGKQNHSLVRKSAMTILLAILVLGVSKLPNLDPRVKHTDAIWSVVTLWDASAVSLEENKIIIPVALKDDSLNLQDLKQHIRDYTNTTVFESGKLKHSFNGPYTAEQKKALIHLMWSLPIEHTQAYFKHRLRLAELLYGLDQKGLPDGQVLMPFRITYGDNPPINSKASPYEQPVLSKLQSWIDTPLFAGWIYLSIALLLCVGIFIRQKPATAGLAITVAVSSLAYALPLALVSGSAEFRYLAWPVLACLMSLALMFCAWRPVKNR